MRNYLFGVVMGAILGYCGSTIAQAETIYFVKGKKVEKSVAVQSLQGGDTDVMKCSIVTLDTAPRIKARK